MNEYIPAFKIYAASQQQAQKISDLLLNILNTVSPEKLERASDKVRQDPSLISKLLKLL